MSHDETGSQVKPAAWLYLAHGVRDRESAERRQQELDPRQRIRPPWDERCLKCDADLSLATGAMGMHVFVSGRDVGELHPKPMDGSLCLSCGHEKGHNVLPLAEYVRLVEAAKAR